MATGLSRTRDQKKIFSGELFVTDLIITDNIGRFHFETWKALHPDAPHQFMTMGERIVGQVTHTGQLCFTDREHFEEFQAWWKWYTDKFSSYTLLPTPKNGLRYYCVEYRGKLTSEGTLELWRWLLENCEGHVGWTSNEFLSSTILDPIRQDHVIEGHLFFEKDNDRTKYILSCSTS